MSFALAQDKDWMLAGQTKFYSGKDNCLLILNFLNNHLLLASKGDAQWYAVQVSDTTILNKEQMMVTKKN